MFKTWDGYIIACPDIDDDHSYYFEGDKSSMVSKSIGVKFEMCDGVGCKPNKEQWLQDV